MTDLLFLLLFAVPLIAINFLSSFAQSLGAKRILFWGSACYLVLLATNYLFELQCVGGFWNPISSCKPAFLYYVAYVLVQPVLLGLLSILYIGPALLISALILEVQSRLLKA